MKRKDTLKKMVVMAMFITIEIILCFTPFIGAIRIGVIDASLAFIPVLIVAIVMGPTYGGLMGFVAGLCSFIYWTFVDPGSISAITFTPFHAYGEKIGSYWSLVVCFVPRILIGVVAGLSYKLFNKLIKKESKLKDIFTYAFSALLGSFTNTFLVLFGTYFLWGKRYAEACEMEFKLLLGIIGSLILTNGIPEAIVGAILTYFIGRVLVKYVMNNPKHQKEIN